MKVIHYNNIDCSDYSFMKGCNLLKAKEAYQLSEIYEEKLKHDNKFISAFHYTESEIVKACQEGKCRTAIKLDATSNPDQVCKVLANLGYIVDLEDNCFTFNIQISWFDKKQDKLRRRYSG